MMSAATTAFASVRVNNNAKYHLDEKLDVFSNIA